METNTAIYIILGIFAFIYLYFKWKFSYWKKMQVPYIQPTIPLGNIQGWRRRVHSSQVMQKFYNQLKGKHCIGGLYFYTKPAVLVLDLELIKKILIRDFAYFQGRGMFYNEKDDPLSAHLFSLEGKKWKNLRAKLTPTFTSGRMKFMFPTIVQVADELQKTLKTIVSTQSEVELSEILARFTTDVIGTCVFGIECNSLKDPNAQFCRMGKKALDLSKSTTLLKHVFMLTFRNLANLLRMKVNDDDVTKFFMKIVKETVEFHEQNNIHRNDFMDLLIQLKTTGRLDGDQPGEEVGTLTLEEIAAQAFVFFLAGFETSSTVMSYCLYELALNQDIQEKARQVINHVLELHGGSFTYEAMMEMTYIDQIINESLRKYSPVDIMRTSSQDYYILGAHGKTRLDRGCTACIPVYAIHHDPDIYPSPEVFDPERFTTEAVKSRHPQAFLAFGDGPRNCIGRRFGKMPVRAGLVTLLKHFRFTPCSKTNIPMTFSGRSIVLAPEGGLWLRAEPL